MTKAELIRKLAKRNGIPDSETKIFFELFLQKASASLKRGEAVKLNGIGYFQLRQGIIKETFASTDENIIYADLMVFFPMRNEEVNSDESLIFNVPVPKEDELNEVDRYFSLSIGKPVIPLEGINDTEYFSPPSAHELKKLIETKVNKIFKSAEIINKYIKGNEVLIIEPEKFNYDQFEFEWVDKKEDIVQGSKNRKLPPDFENKAEFEHLAWDFGEDLSKEIEEEAIIDSANFSELKSDDSENEEALEWDFGIPDSDVGYPAPGDKAEENFADETSGRNVEVPVPEEIKGIENSESGKFQRVKSIVSGAEESLEKTDVEMNPGKKGGDAKESNYRVASETDFEEKRTEETWTEDKRIKTSEKNSDIEEKSKATAAEIVRTQKRSNEPDRTVNKKQEKAYDKKNSTMVFIIALSAVIIVGIAFFMFLRKGISNAPEVSGNKELSGTLPASTPVVIERSYRIPVTYPYPPGGNKSELNQTNGGKTGIKNPNGENNAAVSRSKNGAGNKGKVKTGETTLSPSPQKSIETPKIMDYISKSGRGYLVQMSSWQSEFVAKKEVQKFKDKGYQSFVDKADIKGRGTWYRVKVGYFKTLIAAEEFFNRNH